MGVRPQLTSAETERRSASIYSISFSVRNRIIENIRVMSKYMMKCKTAKFRYSSKKWRNRLFDFFSSDAIKYFSPTYVTMPDWVYLGASP